MTAPERIWLRAFQNGDIQATRKQQIQMIYAVGYEDCAFIRADLAAAVVAERDALRAEVERLRASITSEITSTKNPG